MKDRACVFCGCTEDNACVVRLAEQSGSVRRAVFALARRQGRPMPETIGCSWFETDPPVCSAPACVDKHVEQLTTTHSP